MKPTKVQQKILDRMKPEHWYSSYELKANINSLWGLERKELVDRKEGLGSLAFPRTSILWKLKPIQMAAEPTHEYGDKE